MKNCSKSLYVVYLQDGCKKEMRKNRRGHVTGQVWKGGRFQTSNGGGKHNFLSWNSDLAKLNPKCNINYLNFKQK